jgi:peroxiredoxin
MTGRLTALVAAIVFVSGCAGGTRVHRIENGMTAPSFELSDISSGTVMDAAKTIRDHGATVITIWSMDCPNCREALLDVQRVYEEYGAESVAFIGVNFDTENIQGVRAFIKGESLEFPTLWDKDGKVARDFEALDYTFSVFIVDRTGTVVLAQYDHPPDLARILAEALDEVLGGNLE